MTHSADTANAEAAKDRKATIINFEAALEAKGIHLVEQAAA